MTARELVETRKVTVTYEIEARIYGDGTVGVERWTARDAAGWSRYVNEAVSPHIRAEAAVLRDLALEAAPKPEEPTLFGFVGTVTTREGVAYPEGKVYDVTCTLNADYRRVFTVYSRGRGVIEGGVSWDRILHLGTFTPRGDA